MKKFLALLMAGIMLLTFAACGGNGEEETTTNPEEITTEAPAANAEGEDATDAEEATEAVTDENGEEVTDEDGEVVTEKVTKEDKTEKPTKEDSKKPTKNEGSKPVSQWSKQEILDYYNKAVVKTDPNAPKGNSKMVLKGAITGEGAMGAILKVLSPAAESALKRNSTPTDFIPGYGELKLSDLKSIKATDNGDAIVVEMTVQKQVDGSDADDKAGPVGRAIGTLGSIDGALGELGAEISSGRDTVALTYDDVTVKATINKSSGLITGGTWHYVVNIAVGNAKASISFISANLKNLKAAVDYTVTI